jgi:hypothetical protein
MIVLVIYFDGLSVFGMEHAVRFSINNVRQPTFGSWYVALDECVSVCGACEDKTRVDLHHQGRPLLPRKSKRAILKTGLRHVHIAISEPKAWHAFGGETSVETFGRWERVWPLNEQEPKSDGHEHDDRDCTDESIDVRVRLSTGTRRFDQTSLISRSRS